MRSLSAFLCLVALVVPGCVTTPEPPANAVLQDQEQLRVMTFNILKGGTDLGHPLRQTAEVIRAARADVVVLQETKNSLRALAEELGYTAHQVNDSVAFLSRFPITTRDRFGIRVQPWPHVGVWILGVHLEAYPYGPYDLRDDSTLTEDALIQVAHDTRGNQFAPVLDQVQRLLEAGEPVVLAGDFNEPSHLDWIDEAKHLHFDRTVAWPTSRQAHMVGLKDTYRDIHPDPVSRPGNTWTPIDAPDEVHDRIDLVYWGGLLLTPQGAEVVGEAGAMSDISVEPYPSDHRGVVVAFGIERTKLSAHPTSR